MLIASVPGRFLIFTFKSKKPYSDNGLSYLG